MRVPAKIQIAFERAKAARKRAYAPYSKFKVGACLVSGDDYFEGCNVENVSYPSGMCAERGALAKAVSEGARKFSDVVVVTGLKVPAAPCGFCLQALSEFVKPNAKVWLANDKKIMEQKSFRSFLPRTLKLKN